MVEPGELTKPHLTHGIEPELTSQHTELMRALFNSIGSTAFRHYFVANGAGHITDIIEDGEYGCAFYLTRILEGEGLINCAHTTVKSSVRCLKDSGWEPVTEYRIGDVVCWDGGGALHLGIAVSREVFATNSSDDRSPILYKGDINNLGVPAIYSHPDVAADVYTNLLFE